MATSAAYIDLDEGAAPATPATGKVRVYAKTDGSAYQKDDAGTETGLASAGSSLGAWTDYTPTWSGTGTPPTLGNATLTGRYKQLDANTYAIRVNFVFGSTSSAGTGAWSFSLPAGLTSIAKKQVIAGHILDSGTRHFLANGVIDASDTKVSLIVNSESAGAGQSGAGAPMTWATGDEINLSGIIEVA